MPEQTPQGSGNLRLAVLQGEESILAGIQNEKNGVRGREDFAANILNKIEYFRQRTFGVHLPGNL